MTLAYNSPQFDTRKYWIKNSDLPLERQISVERLQEDGYTENLNFFHNKETDMFYFSSKQWWNDVWDRLIPQIEQEFYEEEGR